MRWHAAVESLVPAMLIFGGVALLLVGLLTRRGPLPGEIRARRGPVTFYSPLGLSLLLSVIATVVLNLAFCAVPR